MSEDTNKERTIDFYEGKFLSPEQPLQYHTSKYDVLSPSQVKQWREKGYCIVNDIIPSSLLRAGIYVKHI